MVRRALSDGRMVELPGCATWGDCLTAVLTGANVICRNAKASDRIIASFCDGVRRVGVALAHATVPMLPDGADVAYIGPAVAEDEDTIFSGLATSGRVATEPHPAGTCMVLVPQIRYGACACGLGIWGVFRCVVEVLETCMVGDGGGEEEGEERAEKWGRLALVICDTVLCGCLLASPCVLEEAGGAGKGGGILQRLLETLADISFGRSAAEEAQTQKVSQKTTSWTHARKRASAALRRLCAACAAVESSPGRPLVGLGNGVLKRVCWFLRHCDGGWVGASELEAVENGILAATVLAERRGLASVPVLLHYGGALVKEVVLKQGQAFARRQTLRSTLVRFALVVFRIIDAAGPEPGLLRESWLDGEPGLMLAELFLGQAMVRGIGVEPVTLQAVDPLACTLPGLGWVDDAAGGWESRMAERIGKGLLGHVLGGERPGTVVEEGHFAGLRSGERAALACGDATEALCGVLAARELQARRHAGDVGALLRAYLLPGDGEGWVRWPPGDSDVWTAVGSLRVIAASIRVDPLRVDAEIRVAALRAAAAAIRGPWARRASAPNARAAAALAAGLVLIELAGARWAHDRSLEHAAHTASNGAQPVAARPAALAKAEAHSWSAIAQGIQTLVFPAASRNLATDSSAAFPSRLSRDNTTLIWATAASACACALGLAVLTAPPRSIDLPTLTSTLLQTPPSTTSAPASQTLASILLLACRRSSAHKNLQSLSGSPGTPITPLTILSAALSHPQFCIDRALDALESTCGTISSSSSSRRRVAHRADLVASAISLQISQTLSCSNPCAFAPLQAVTLRGDAGSTAAASLVWAASARAGALSTPKIPPPPKHPPPLGLLPVAQFGDDGGATGAALLLNLVEPADRNDVPGSIGRACGAAWIVVGPTASTVLPTSIATPAGMIALRGKTLLASSVGLWSQMPGRSLPGPAVGTCAADGTGCGAGFAADALDLQHDCIDYIPPPQKILAPSKEHFLLIFRRLAEIGVVALAMDRSAARSTPPIPILDSFPPVHVITHPITSIPAALTLASSLASIPPPFSNHLDSPPVLATMEALSNLSAALLSSFLVAVAPAIISTAHHAPALARDPIVDAPQGPRLLCAILGLYRTLSPLLPHLPSPLVQTLQTFPQLAQLALRAAWSSNPASLPLVRSILTKALQHTDSILSHIFSDADEDSDDDLDDEDEEEEEQPDQDQNQQPPQNQRGPSVAPFSGGGSSRGRSPSVSVANRILRAAGRRAMTIAAIGDDTTTTTTTNYSSTTTRPEDEESTSMLLPSGRATFRPQLPPQPVSARPRNRLSGSRERVEPEPEDDSDSAWSLDESTVDVWAAAMRAVPATHESLVLLAGLDDQEHSILAMEVVGRAMARTCCWNPGMSAAVRATVRELHRRGAWATALMVLDSAAKELAMCRGRCAAAERARVLATARRILPDPSLKKVDWTATGVHPAEALRALIFRGPLMDSAGGRAEALRLLARTLIVCPPAWLDAGVPGKWEDDLADSLAPRVLRGSWGMAALSRAPRAAAIEAATAIAEQFDISPLVRFAAGAPPPATLSLPPPRDPYELARSGGPLSYRGPPPLASLSDSNAQEISRRAGALFDLVTDTAPEPPSAERVQQLAQEWASRAADLSDGLVLDHRLTTLSLWGALLRSAMPGPVNAPAAAAAVELARACRGPWGPWARRFFAIPLQHGPASLSEAIAHAVGSDPTLAFLSEALPQTALAEAAIWTFGARCLPPASAASAAADDSTSEIWAREPWEQAIGNPPPQSTTSTDQATDFLPLLLLAISAGAIGSQAVALRQGSDLRPALRAYQEWITRMADEAGHEYLPIPFGASAPYVLQKTVVGAPLQSPTEPVELLEIASAANPPTTAESLASKALVRIHSLIDAVRAAPPPVAGGGHVVVRGWLQALRSIIPEHSTPLTPHKSWSTLRLLVQPWDPLLAASGILAVPIQGGDPVQARIDGIIGAHHENTSYSQTAQVSAIADLIAQSHRGSSRPPLPHPIHPLPQTPIPDSSPLPPTSDASIRDAACPGAALFALVQTAGPSGAACDEFVDRVCATAATILAIPGSTQVSLGGRPANVRSQSYALQAVTILIDQVLPPTSSIDRWAASDEVQSILDSSKYVCSTPNLDITRKCAALVALARNLPQLATAASCPDHDASLQQPLENLFRLLWSAESRLLGAASRAANSGHRLPPLLARASTTTSTTTKKKSSSSGTKRAASSNTSRRVRPRKASAQDDDEDEDFHDDSSPPQKTDLDPSWVRSATDSEYEPPKKTPGEQLLAISQVGIATLLPALRTSIRLALASGSAPNVCCIDRAVGSLAHWNELKEWFEGNEFSWGAAYASVDASDTLASRFLDLATVAEDVAWELEAPAQNQHGCVLGAREETAIRACESIQTWLLKKQHDLLPLFVDECAAALATDVVAGTVQRGIATLYRLAAARSPRLVSCARSCIEHLHRAIRGDEGYGVIAPEFLAVCIPSVPSLASLLPAWWRAAFRGVGVFPASSDAIAWSAGTSSLSIPWMSSTSEVETTEDVPPMLAASLGQRVGLTGAMVSDGVNDAPGVVAERETGCHPSEVVRYNPFDDGPNQKVSVDGSHHQNIDLDLQIPIRLADDPVRTLAPNPDSIVSAPGAPIGASHEASPSFHLLATAFRVSLPPGGSTVRAHERLCRASATTVAIALSASELSIASAAGLVDLSQASVPDQVPNLWTIRPLPKFGEQDEFDQSILALVVNEILEQTTMPIPTASVVSFIRARTLLSLLRSSYPTDPQVAGRRAREALYRLSYSNRGRAATALLPAVQRRALRRAQWMAAMEDQDAARPAPDLYLAGSISAQETILDEMSKDAPSAWARPPNSAEKAASLFVGSDSVAVLDGRAWLCFVAPLVAEWTTDPVLRAAGPPAATDAVLAREMIPLVLLRVLWEGARASERSEKTNSEDLPLDVDKRDDPEFLEFWGRGANCDVEVGDKPRLMVDRLRWLYTVANRTLQSAAEYATSLEDSRATACACILDAIQLATMARAGAAALTSSGPSAKTTIPLTTRSSGFSCPLSISDVLAPETVEQAKVAADLAPWLVFGVDYFTACEAALRLAQLGSTAHRSHAARLLDIAVRAARRHPDSDTQHALLRRARNLQTTIDALSQGKTTSKPSFILPGPGQPIAPGSYDSFSGVLPVATLSKSAKDEDVDELLWSVIGGEERLQSLSEWRDLAERYQVGGEDAAAESRKMVSGKEALVDLLRLADVGRNNKLDIDEAVHCNILCSAVAVHAPMALNVGVVVEKEEEEKDGVPIRDPSMALAWSWAMSSLAPLAERRAALVRVTEPRVTAALGRLSAMLLPVRGGLELEDGGDRGWFRDDARRRLWTDAGVGIAALPPAALWSAALECTRAVSPASVSSAALTAMHLELARWSDAALERARAARFSPAATARRQAAARRSEMLDRLRPAYATIKALREQQRSSSKRRRSSGDADGGLADQLSGKYADVLKEAFGRHPQAFADPMEAAAIVQERIFIAPAILEDAAKDEAEERAMRAHLELALREYTAALLTGVGSVGHCPKTGVAAGATRGGSTAERLATALRWVSLWCSRAQMSIPREYEPKRVESLQNTAAAVPAAALAPAAPQLVARLATLPVLAEQDPNTILADLVARVAVARPHSTLPPLLAIAGTGLPPSSSPTPDRSPTARNTKRIVANGILDMLYRGEVDPNVRTAVHSHQLLASIYVALASKTFDRAARGGKHALSSIRTNTEQIQITSSKKKSSSSRLRRSSTVTFASVLRDAISTGSVPILTAEQGASVTPRVAVQAFEEMFTVAKTGLSLPRVITLYGTDGRTYEQVVKPDKDIRQDAAVQQVFGVLNALFSADAAARSHGLRLRTYRVVPLARTGVIEFIRGAGSLGEAVEHTRKRHFPSEPSVTEIGRRYSNAQDKMHNARQRMQQLLTEGKQTRAEALDKVIRAPSARDLAEASTKIRVERRATVEAFRSLLSSLSSEPLSLALLERQPDARSWSRAQRLYASSLAASSVAGFAIGLGDRHASNVMLDLATGEVVHIDFGVMFGTGSFLIYPERVPFRLTRNLVTALGVHGTTGPFRDGACETMRVLRSKNDLVLAILDGFLHDPMVRWSALPSANAGQDPISDPDNEDQDNDDQYQDDSNPEAVAVVEGMLDECRRKLEGYVPDPCGIEADIDSDVSIAEPGAPPTSRPLESIATNPSVGHRDGPFTVPDQVDRLISQATDDRRLCSLFRGWSPWI